MSNHLTNVLTLWGSLLLFGGAVVIFLNWVYLTFFSPRVKQKEQDKKTMDSIKRLLEKPEVREDRLLTAALEESYQVLKKNCR